jgi:hypothetical protein
MHFVTLACLFNAMRHVAKVSPYADAIVVEIPDT